MGFLGEVEQVEAAIVETVAVAVMADGVWGGEVDHAVHEAVEFAAGGGYIGAGIDGAVGFDGLPVEGFEPAGVVVIDYGEVVLTDRDQGRGFGWVDGSGSCGDVHGVTR